jgi:SAM-dependent methyltransferase
MWRDFGYGDTGKMTTSAARPAVPRGAGTNPVELCYGHALQQRALALFASRSRVLALGCGLGSDAVALALRGHRVLGLDPSAARIAQARELADASGLEAARLSFEVVPADQLHRVHERFDAALVDASAYGTLALASLGRALASSLGQGAPVLLQARGPWPLPATLRRALTGVGERRVLAAPDGGRRRIGPGRLPSVSEARRELRGDFAWTGGFALGLLLPEPALSQLALDHPVAFGALAALERVLRRWPLLRGLGDRYVLEGARR